jgi:hypothetical protein
MCVNIKRLAQFFNPLKPKGKYMYHVLYQSVTLYFVLVDFV